MWAKTSPPGLTRFFSNLVWSSARAWAGTACNLGYDRSQRQRYIRQSSSNPSRKMQRSFSRYLGRLYVQQKSPTTGRLRPFLRLMMGLLMTPLSRGLVVTEMGVLWPPTLWRSPLYMILVKYVPPCKSYSNGDEVLRYCHIIVGCCLQVVNSINIHLLRYIFMWAKTASVGEMIISATFGL